MQNTVAVCHAVWAHVGGPKNFVMVRGRPSKHDPPSHVLHAEFGRSRSMVWV